MTEGTFEYGVRHPNGGSVTVRLAGRNLTSDTARVAASSANRNGCRMCFTLPDSTGHEVVMRGAGLAWSRPMRMPPPVERETDEVVGALILARREAATLRAELDETRARLAARPSLSAMRTIVNEVRKRADRWVSDSTPSGSKVNAQQFASGMRYAAAIVHKAVTEIANGTGIPRVAP